MESRIRQGKSTQGNPITIASIIFRIPKSYFKIIPFEVKQTYQLTSSLTRCESSSFDHTEVASTTAWSLIPTSFLAGLDNNCDGKVEICLRDVSVLYANLYVVPGTNVKENVTSGSPVHPGNLSAQL